jgi:hypothetical protein
MIRAEKLGIVVSRWQEIPKVVAELWAAPDRISQLAQRVAALPENRAVFEVLEILEREVSWQPSAGSGVLHAP